MVFIFDLSIQAVALANQKLLGIPSVSCLSSTIIISGTNCFLNCSWKLHLSSLHYLKFAGNL